MKNQPGNMKNQPGIMKNHENRPGTVNNQPGTMNTHENRPGTINKQKRYKQTDTQNLPIIYRLYAFSNYAIKITFKKVKEEEVVGHSRSFALFDSPARVPRADRFPHRYEQVVII